MPSLMVNSPNVVSECIEHGIPFVATKTGGIPELVAEDDRARVLCEPTPGNLAVALGRALTSRPDFAPARPAREQTDSIAAWLELAGTAVPSPTSPAPAANRVALAASGEPRA